MRQHIYTLSLSFPGINRSAYGIIHSPEMVRKWKELARSMRAYVRTHIYIYANERIAFSARLSNNPVIHSTRSIVLWFYFRDSITNTAVLGAQMWPRASRFIHPLRYPSTRFPALAAFSSHAFCLKFGKPKEFSWFAADFFLPLK